MGKDVDFLAEILGDINGVLASCFDQMEWAEDEIEKAILRHPAEQDTIYHSFSLLRPTHDLMGTEFVYRAHCRELLDRVADGTDTRLGTAAEVCCACSVVSQTVPMNTAAAGLYIRMWHAAGFPELDALTDCLPHYEALEHSAIDDFERLSRRKLTVADRRLGDIDCRGQHHGEPVQCKYHG